MQIGFNFITGFMVGIEFYDDVLQGKGLIIDLGIFRLIFDWSED